MLPNIANIKDTWKDGSGRKKKKTIVKEQFNILLPFPHLSQKNLNEKGKNGGRTCDSE